MKTVSDVGERGLIKIISEILGGLGNEIISGEDDAVAVNLSEPSTLVINNDVLVSTTDVPPQMTLFQAARKAVVMTVSDILVKGAVPKWAVVGLGLEKDLALEGNNGFKGLISGLKAGFEEYNIQYLGGDLNKTKEIIISCTIFGDAPYGVITRLGAKPGDFIVCSGEMGKTGCGFSILLEHKSNIADVHNSEFIESVLHPRTPLLYGQILRSHNWASASCDSSDGIVKTINEICAASHTGAEIEWNLLPITKNVKNFCSKNGIDINKIIFSSGEEFIHIFTIPKDKIDESLTYFQEKNLPLYVIGNITDNEGQIILKKQSQKQNLMNFIGYEHFKEKK